MDGRSAVTSLAVLTTAALALNPVGCASRKDDASLAMFRTRLVEVEHHRLEHPGHHRGSEPRSFNPRGAAAQARACGSGTVFQLTEFGDQQEPSPAGERVSGDTTVTSDLSSSRAPLSGLWDTVKRDLRDLPGVFWEDTKAVYTDKSNLLVLGLTYGASLTLQQTGTDDTVENSFRRHGHRTFNDDFLDGFGAAGNPAIHFGLAGLWYLVGQQTQDEKTYNVGTKLFRALTLNGVSTMLGKAATWDRGPNGEWGTFPSGHTSSTFALASVMHHEYGPLAGVPLYGLGVLVGYTRLEDDEHYLSDVVMGGVLGLVIGHTIANDDQPPEVFGGRILPYADPASASTGIAWVKPLRYRD